jgi:sec-independent protein translocase protein TatA
MSTPAANLPLALFNFGGSELVLILLVLLLLFGGTKLPALARGLGQSIREFKKAVREDDTEAKPAAPAEAAKKEAATPPHGSN